MLIITQTALELGFLYALKVYKLSFLIIFSFRFNSLIWA